jgi:hypothetical protein
VAPARGQRGEVHTPPPFEPCLNCRNVRTLGGLHALDRMPDTQAIDVEAQGGCDLHKYHDHSPGPVRMNPGRRYGSHRQQGSELRKLGKVELWGFEPQTSCMPVSLGMSVPGIPAGTGQGGCLVAPGDSLHA